MNRIFWGVWLLLFATPIFIRTFDVGWTEGWIHALATIGLALGVALLWPKRWAK
jgi:hypothetical protein